MIQNSSGLPSRGSVSHVSNPYDSSLPGSRQSINSLWSVSQPRGLYSVQAQALNQELKAKNRELAEANSKYSSDVNLLKRYCLTLEHQLNHRGYLSDNKDEGLQRKQTAEGLFLDAKHHPSLSELRASVQFQKDLVMLRQSNQQLEKEKQMLQVQIKSLRQINQELQSKLRFKAQQADKKEKSVQVGLGEDAIAKLLKQIKELRKINEALSIQKEKQKVEKFILRDRQKFSEDIKELLGKYRRKMKDLASEKKDMEKKYKVLKERVGSHDPATNSQVVDLYAQKVEILQKLTEKQQFEIENTIRVYETELQKIEERRKEQIQYMQNERLGIESQNLKLCIELQKSLNQNEQMNQVVAYHKGISKKLTFQIQDLQESLKLAQSKQKLFFKLVIQSQVVSEKYETEQKLRKVMFVNGIKIQKNEFIKKLDHKQGESPKNYEYEYSDVQDQQMIDKMNQKLEDKCQSNSTQKQISKGQNLQIKQSMDRKWKQPESKQKPNKSYLDRRQRQIEPRQKLETMSQPDKRQKQIESTNKLETKSQAGKRQKQVESIQKFQNRQAQERRKKQIEQKQKIQSKSQSVTRQKPVEHKLEQAFRQDHMRPFLQQRIETMRPIEPRVELQPPYIVRKISMGPVEIRQQWIHRTNNMVYYQPPPPPPQGYVYRASAVMRPPSEINNFHRNNDYVVKVNPRDERWTPSRYQ